MTAVPKEVENKIRAALRPNRTEIVRAKNLILDLARSGDVIGVGQLQRVLIEAEEVRDPQHGEKLEMGDAGDYSEQDLRILPLIAHKRLALAACEALVDLVAQGSLIESASAPRGTGPHNQVIGSNDTVSIGLQYRSLGTSVSARTNMPNFAAGYRLLPRYADSELPWFLDSDLFLQDLDDLQLSARAQRCLHEAIEAYRRGLYLASVNLLGTASEGAWFTAAARLSDIDERLQKTVAQEGVQALTVRKKVIEVLNQKGASKKLVAGLESTAELFRRLRNYGLHPKDEEESDLERFLTEPAAGALLLEAHSYFSTLGRAVDLRLEQEVASDD